MALPRRRMDAADHSTNTISMVSPPDARSASGYLKWVGGKQRQLAQFDPLLPAAERE